MKTKKTPEDIANKLTELVEGIDRQILFINESWPNIPVTDFYRS